jgi:hypothetical protein
MKKEKFYENYPFWMVLVSNLNAILIYLIGAYIIYQTGLIWMTLYIIYILIFEFKLIKGHCVDCFYYGKTCAFGKGKIACLFFKKGNPKRFCKKLGWKDIIPEFMISLIPIIVGVILLIIKFNWIMSILIIVLLFLTFAGNALVRRNIACKYCKQRKLGCPAEQLFDGKKGGK